MFKKVLAVGLSAVLGLSMIGCGSSSTKLGDGEIKLGDYKDYFVVYEDDMKSYIDSYYAQVESYLLSQAKTTKKVKEGTVKDDSTVNMDYTGKIEVDGKKVAFEGGSTDGNSVSFSIASNATTEGQSYIEGFGDAIKGHKVGETFTAKMKFPDTYTNTTKVDGKDVSLAGKDVWFTITVNYLEETKTPEKLTDAIVKEHAGIDDVKTIKELKEYVEENYGKTYIVNTVLQKLVDNCEVVKYDQKEEESQFEAQKSSVSSQYGASFEDYLEACSITEEEWKKQVEDTVHDTLKAKMIILAIAEEQKLNPTDKEYQSEAESIGEQMSQSVEELESQYGKDTVEYSIVAQRVQDYITENITKKKGSEPTTAAPETTEAKEETTKAKEETTKAK